MVRRDTTLPREVLSKYMNNYFVETGTSEGSGVQLALDLGFKNIISIEIDPELQNKNVERFGDRAKLITGDSLSELRKITPTLIDPATFWLDSHYEKRGPMGIKECPLYEELVAIKLSKINTHTIMIDDVRMFGKSKWGTGILKDRIIQLLRSINRKYLFTYEDSPMAKGDILVAHV